MIDDLDFKLYLFKYWICIPQLGSHNVSYSSGKFWLHGNIQSRVQQNHQSVRIDRDRPVFRTYAQRWFQSLLWHRGPKSSNQCGLHRSQRNYFRFPQSRLQSVHHRWRTKQFYLRKYHQHCYISSKQQPKWCSLQHTIQTFESIELKS